MKRIAFGSLLVLCLLPGCEPTKPRGTSGTGLTGSGASAANAKPVARVAPTGPMGTGNPTPGPMPDAAPRAGGTEIELFNGKDLTGWVVTECETEVKDGVLLLKAGEGWVRTENKYRDFVLSWECKNLKPADYDSGVHFRADLPAEKAHWPTKYQVNLKTGNEGNVKPLNAASTGFYKNGEWNKFKLTVVLDKAELEINGNLAWNVGGVEVKDGYIGLQSEVTLGGQFEFKNIKLKKLGTP
jgi:hypothetical protein